MEEKKRTARPRGTDSAKVVRVIMTEGLEGAGTPEDPCRKQVRYWTMDGRLIATLTGRSGVMDAVSVLDD